jgi:hypothetical protein
MSLALTDFLIAVSDPTQFHLFKRDPERFMSRCGLGEEHKKAIRSGDSTQIRFHARSTTPDDPAHSSAQFKGSLNPAVLTEIDPTVEIVNEHNDQVAIGGQGLLFVDDRGRVYRGVPV